MRAAVITAFDRPPRYGTVGCRAPGPGEVAVDMLAAALSPRVRSGAAGQHYTSGDTLPIVAGVDGVGRGADGHLVYVLATGADGTMAEQAVVDRSHLVPLPDGIDPVAAAAAAIAGMSSWVALRSRVALRPGQNVLVLGATGVAGRMAVQIAKTLGARRVVAAGRDPGRLAALTDIGADAIVPLGTDTDAHDLTTAAAGVDVVLDYLWGAVTERALPAIVRAHTEGPLQWVSIGSTAGPEIALPSAALRSRNLHLLGSGQGSATTAELLSGVAELMDALAAGSVEVATRAVPLSEVESAWDAPEEPGRRTVFTI